MKRKSFLKLLSSDHQHGLVIARLLQSNENVEALNFKDIKEKFIKFYNSELLRHFEEEEKCFIPHVKKIPLINRMFEEHKQLKKIFALINFTNEKCGAANLLSFGNLLYLHIRFEERELFPMIEKNLSDEQLEQIENIIKEIKLLPNP